MKTNPLISSAPSVQRHHLVTHLDVSASSFLSQSFYFCLSTLKTTDLMRLSAYSRTHYESNVVVNEL